MCKCFEMTDKALQQYNTRLTPMVLWDKDSGLTTTRITISTEKIDSHKRQGPVRLSANYCPFCGEKLEEVKED